METLTKWLLSAVAVACCGMTLSACTATKAGGPPEMPPMSVRLEPASMQVLDESSTFVATLKSRKSVNLKPQVSGRLLQIFVKSGDDVVQGQAIAELDKSKQEAQVANCEAALESAIAERATAEAMLKSLKANRLSKISTVKFAQTQFGRYERLHSEGAISAEMVDRVRNDQSVAAAELEAVDAQIKAQEATIGKCAKQIAQARATLREQQEQLRYFTVRAPFNGVIGDVPVKIGDFVDTDTMLTTVDEDHPLELYVAVPMMHSTKLRLGQTCEIVDEQGKVIDRGSIFFISPQVDQKDQSVLAKAELMNQSHRFRSGQLVNARVMWERVDAVTIPVTAVTRLSGQDFVFVAEDDGKGKTIVKQKAVKLGEIQDNKYRVLSGVSAGDRIVTSGVQNLFDGSPVQPQS